MGEANVIAEDFIRLRNKLSEFLPRYQKTAKAGGPKDVEAIAACFRGLNELEKSAARIECKLENDDALQALPDPRHDPEKMRALLESFRENLRPCFEVLKLSRARDPQEFFAWLQVPPRVLLPRRGVDYEELRETWLREFPEAGIERWACFTAPARRAEPSRLNPEPTIAVELLEQALLECEDLVKTLEERSHGGEGLATASQPSLQKGRKPRVRPGWEMKAIGHIEELHGISDTDLGRLVGADRRTVARSPVIKRARALLLAGSRQLECFKDPRTGRFDVKTGRAGRGE